MLASTVQFSRCGRDYRHVADSPWSTIRCAQRGLAVPVVHMHDMRNRSLRTQQRAWAPNPSPSQRSHRMNRLYWLAWRARCLLVNVPPMSDLRDSFGHDEALDPRTGQMLLRKEVIQPHLPVRLPCYDFVPIASPTFDGSLPEGLGHRLRVLPTFVT